jgi:ABC-type sulfate transport system substrate-binding protein
MLSDPVLFFPLQLGLPPAKLWTVDEVFGGWAAAQARFFDAGAVLDVIQEAVSGRSHGGA